MTHYASGQAAVYYGSGFMRLQDVFTLGAACGMWGLLVWGGPGMLWWKALGWY
jgi:DASS family divalent anion:Na+ symporter